MVEIFKTNIRDPDTAQELTARLLSHYPACRINFDLDDCDNILRIEGPSFCVEDIIETMNNLGFRCQALV